jgi:23S rRNA pseudouridine1911/1915/1917 synthase
LADPAFDSLSDHDAEAAFDGDFAADDVFEEMAPITLELTPDACGQRLDKVISGWCRKFRAAACKCGWKPVS